MADNLMPKTISLNYSESEIRGKTSQSLTLRECPWCGRHWKLNVNMQKGVFRCPACGEAGNAVKLHSMLNGLSKEESYKELSDKALKPKKIISVETAKEVELASLPRRNAVYSTIIRHGICSNEQWQDLTKRGMPESNFRWYTTMVSGLNDSASAWCKELRNVLYENGVKGVPGLYGKVILDEKGFESKDQLHLNLPKNLGYLIPVITHRQGKPMISCCQIRHFTGKTRYSFFTSLGQENGSSVSGCNKVHYTRNFWNEEGKMEIPESVNLTEGALKADIASVLSGRKFIAILGVNDTKDLKHELIFLKENGCKAINICFDMDYQDNPNVAKALEKVKEIIISSGLKARTIKWDKNHKGIDDYLLFTKNAEKTTKGE